MAITVMFDFQGLTKGTYEQLIQNLIAAGAAPVGRTFHSASEKPGGLLVVDVWESVEKFQAFGAKLMPIAQGLSIAVPEPQVFPTIVAVAG
jgi:hypothetical protein